MNDGANPLVPAADTFLVSGIAAVLVLLLVWAVIRLARSRVVTAGERLGLLIFCLMFPVLGPVCTLVLLDRRGKARPKLEGSVGGTQQRG
ncbi:hypothetical protein GD627_00050 [Arthrobacter yangruifuii]|uniref:Cardiolipin synthase N-terminal domain-containing protein n=1 Tax=Arthrobacter yangruifuii TaxID=2606616 RepID=A0A5N6MS12_9MICC|nr:hypothetical protein [Arthrobacter yangruifuii]KAD4059550.1 hypothetical protein GD627_00050 [Arthrobacter yangruifuii]